MDCSMPGFPVFHHLLEFPQTQVHWVSDAIQPSHRLSSPTPPALNLSQYQSLFQWISSSHQVPRVLELNFSISPSNKYSRLISLRIDWFGLLAVQGTLKSLLQLHSSKVSILCHSAFFMIRFLHSYMTTGKTIALTIQTFVDKVMSLLFNTLSKCHSFFSKEQKSFNFTAAGTNCSDFRDQENKVCHCFHHFPTYLPWSGGTGCHDLSFLSVEF